MKLNNKLKGISKKTKGSENREEPKAQVNWVNVKKKISVAKSHSK